MSDIEEDHYADAMEVEAVAAEDEMSSAEDNADDDEEEAIVEAQAVEAHNDDDDVDDDDDHNNNEEFAAVAAPIEDEEDDDEEAVAAAVVVDEDEDSNEVDVHTLPPSKPRPTKSSSGAAGGATAKKVNKKKKTAAASTKKSTASNSTTTTQPPSKKKKKKKPEGSSSELAGYAKVPPERLEAGADARAMLRETVPTLPMAVAETQVRSFGHLVLDSPKDAAAHSRFATTSALYPIGFSCDRYEFSPVHGRTLKLRCSILDGRIIKRKQKASGHPVSKIHDGPIFRILWGRGVDEEVDTIDYPFDPKIHAQPVGRKDKSSSSASTTSLGALFLPEPHMRVKVRFDKHQYFGGTVLSVVKPEVTSPKFKKARTASSVAIRIRYDDGSVETIQYPDPDVKLAMPGAENDIDDQGRLELTQIDDKPVISVVGESPLEAWGKVLTKLGLLDEIMLDMAMDQVVKSRAQGLQEAKQKLEGKFPLPPHHVPRSVTKSPLPDRGSPDSRAASPYPVSSNGDDEGGSTPAMEESNDGEQAVEAEQIDEDREPMSEREKHLREMLQEVTEELEEVEAEERSAAIALADARIHAVGPLLCNPFHDDESGKSQQSSWLATAVRKEKTRMGSTGNRRKVVTALDLLERNDTFYNADIEALIEGLPGSEYCGAYVYQAFRSGGSTLLNRAWIHEAQLRQEKEAIKLLKRSRECEVKEQQEQERAQKKRKREEDRDEKKRQRLEEEDHRRKLRIDERLSKLKLQVEDRLYKEASFQRERAAAVLAKSVSKEFVRRRRAAELVASQSIIEEKNRASIRGADAMVALSAIPPISKIYDEDSVRVWNFMSTFGTFFLERGFIAEIPTLDSLQDAVDCLRGTSRVTAMAADDAVTSLTDLAIALCKPLAASLTRVLFASLIALNPILQKDFGAAFFNEVNATSTKDRKEEEAGDEPTTQPSDLLLPVNSMTWQDIARVSFLSDALGELGYARHEAAHLLRGYRSAGHPNSKEARRLRQAEDNAIALLRQEISSCTDVQKRDPKVPFRIEVPCRPTAAALDLRFFLSNIKSASDKAFSVIHDNLASAIRVLPSLPLDEALLVQSNLEQATNLIQGIAESEHPSKNELKVLRKVRNLCIDSLEKASTNKSTNWTWKQRQEATLVLGDGTRTVATRQTMGLLDGLLLCKSEFKELSHRREKYMEDALRLKEEMEREKLKDEDDEDDEDEDDEDDNGESRVEIVAQIDLNHTDSPSDAKELRESTDLPVKIGKETPYDDFCADIPLAPELIRRCLAVLRALAMTGPAEPFHYPVDPQTNPGYYDMVLQPMCLREAGRQLRVAADAHRKARNQHDQSIEAAVAQFGRNIRLIAQNCLSYANAGPTVISAGSELLRIFERLFLDWVLAPDHLLPSLNELDDDRCIDHHPSDEQSTVLLCDSCEGKFNITRLNPPLRDIPKGDWFCPRCVSGRWWGHLDPRIGKRVKGGTDNSFEGNGEATIEKCAFRCPEKRQGNSTLMYQVRFIDGRIEQWSLEKLDSALAISGLSVPAIKCLEAVSESPGYGYGVDHGLRVDLVPVPLNPYVSDAAAQVVLSSSVFRDTITASATLLVIDPREMTASEWLRLLVLLTMKCSSSDVIQNVVSEMESKAAETMSLSLEKLSKVTDIKDILPEVIEDDGDVPPIEESASHVIGESDFVESQRFDTSNGKSDETRPSTPKVERFSVVEASSVEFVEDVDMDTMPDTPGSISTQEATQVAEAIPINQEKVDIHVKAKKAKSKRDRIIEDSIVGYNVKSQLRPALASFEQDSVSSVIDSSLTKNPTLDFSKMRCRRTVCHFCGLTDAALGLPLVRVPNEEEWSSLIALASRGRRTHLIAEVPAIDVVSSPHTKHKEPKLVSLSIRVGEEIISAKETLFTKLDDVGMLQLIPRSEQGFQSDLLFKYNLGLPFVSGSLSAHESCAVAAHNARKEMMIEKYRARRAELVEKEAGMACGRTLQLGQDRMGRTFWKFLSDSESLFVCTDSTGKSAPSDQPVWHRYSYPESIASVLVGLDKDDVVKDLERVFPFAVRMVKERTWTDMLLKKKFPQVSHFLSHGAHSNGDAMDINGERSVEVEGGFDPYSEGEEVLVESKSGDLLWDASVIEVSTGSGDDLVRVIDAYKVSYNGWSARFEDWVKPSRVIEPNENNRLLQDELLEQYSETRGGLPPALNMLRAKDYLNIRDRARGNLPLPDFARIAYLNEGMSSSEKTFGLAKAALLAVDAALPIGSLDATDKGPWRSTYAERWRSMVKKAEGPAQLMRCIILLEDTITEDWIKQDLGHLRTVLPGRWKALGEATPAGLAMRIILLDRAIMYETVDRKRFSCKKKQK